MVTNRSFCNLDQADAGEPRGSLTAAETERDDR